MTTKRLSNFSMYLPDNVQDKITEIQKATGISTKAGAIIEAINQYLKTSKP